MATMQNTLFGEKNLGLEWPKRAWSGGEMRLFLQLLDLEACYRVTTIHLVFQNRKLPDCMHLQKITSFFAAREQF
jgi:hypothetical protein